MHVEADNCAVRGVMRVVHIDMRNTSVNCPAPLTQYGLDSGERMCGFGTVCTNRRKHVLMIKSIYINTHNSFMVVDRGYFVVESLH